MLSLKCTRFPAGFTPCNLHDVRQAVFSKL
jgi:hypothetical protein